MKKIRIRTISRPWLIVLCLCMSSSLGCATSESEADAILQKYLVLFDRVSNELDEVHDEESRKKSTLELHKIAAEFEELENSSHYITRGTTEKLWEKYDESIRSQQKAIFEKIKKLGDDPKNKEIIQIVEHIWKELAR